MAKAKNDHHKSSMALKSAVLWLQEQRFLRGETNKEIATKMGISENLYTQVWRGRLPASKKFIAAFEDTFLTEHEVSWPDFEDVPPVSSKLRQQATNDVMDEAFRKIHKRLDNLEDLVKTLISNLKK